MYANHKEIQYSQIQGAKELGYKVAIFDGMLDSHLHNYIEQKFEKVKCKRIDAAAIDKLVDKGETIETRLRNHILRSAPIRLRKFTCATTEPCSY